MKHFIGLVAVLAMVASVSPAGMSPAIASSVAPNTLEGWCDDGDIRLRWDSHPDANSNGLLKGDLFPGDPDRFWGWLSTNSSQRSYVDRNVTPGTTYSYKVKYRPELSSNTVAVTCPVRRPVSRPVLECSPSVQYADSGEWVSFSARYTRSHPSGQYRLSWRAVDGYPSRDSGGTFSTRFFTDDRQETYRVTVTDGARTATCTVHVRDEESVRTLTISPTSRTVNSGESVTFRATGGTGHYSWSAPDTVPYRETGSIWTLRFHNDTRYTQTHRVTVRSGSQSRTATVWVRPSPYRYPVPAPELNDILECYPPELTAVSGEEVVFRAYGGTGTYTWTSPEARPTSGHGAHFSVRFTNNSTRVRSFWVTLSSGWQTRVCQVNVAPSSVVSPPPAGGPAPTYSPPPAGGSAVSVNDRLDLFQSGRNLSGGQVADSWTVYAKRNDRVEFVVTVKNTSGVAVRNIRLTDLLPYGLAYVNGSATINGVRASDELTSTGLALGDLNAGQSAHVAFAVSVQPNAVPGYGSRTLYNTAQVRADNADLQVSRLPVVLSNSGILGSASSVNTGVVGSIALASLAALAVAAGYMLYTRTQGFDRRFALAAVRRHRANKESLNFARLIK